MADEYSPPEPRVANFNFAEGGYTPRNPLDADFNFALFIFRVLAGSSNIFTSIWADLDAGRENGKMYVLSWGPGAALSVLNLATKTLYDRYTQTEKGRGNENLTNTDTRDLNA